MSRFLRFLAAVFFPLLLSVLLAAWWFKDYLERELPPAATAEVFVLKSGAGFSAVVDQAAAKNWLRQPAVLKIYARLRPSTAHIRAGEYRLPEGVTVGEWLAMMQRGDVISYQTTIVEGWTLAQAIQHLQRSSLLAGDELPVDRRLWARIGVESPFAESPEGLFFPDTYQFHRGDSLEAVLAHAYQKMLQVLDEEWQARALGLPYRNPYDALIMASIVEKETGLASERERIAGVFVRRLQKNMLLQTDPTVIYGLGDGFSGNLRARDLRDASNPYNSYRHAGLPPTPIALPGREAISAALHPDDSEALYFVARGDGSHQFSATLAEHRAAVQKYQIQQRRSDYRSAPARESVQ